MQERKYKVYSWTNQINGKKYVGLTCRTLIERAGKYGLHYSGSPHFYNAIKRYGWDNFHGLVLEDNLTKEEAASREQYYIKKFGTLDPKVGYNIQEGGFPTGELLHKLTYRKRSIVISIKLIFEWRWRVVSRGTVQSACRARCK